MKARVSEPTPTPKELPQQPLAEKEEWVAGAYAMWRGGASEERIEKWVKWIAGIRVGWPQIVEEFNAAHLPGKRSVPSLLQKPKLGPAFCTVCGLKAFQYRATVEVRYGKVERDPQSVVCFLCAEGEGE